MNVNTPGKESCLFTDLVVRTVWKPGANSFERMKRSKRSNRGRPSDYLPRDQHEEIKHKNNDKPEKVQHGTKKDEKTTTAIEKTEMT